MRSQMEEPVEMVIPRPYLGFIRNPFYFIGAHESFLFGLLIILITGFVGSVSNTHFDGALDIHTGATGPLWIFLAPGFFNWLALAIPLYFAAWAVSGKRPRLGDLLSYQAFARAPMLVAVLFTLIPAFQRQAEHPTVFTGDTIAFTIVLLVIMAMIVLMVVWMYKGFSRSARRTGPKPIAVFIASLVVGEILSKIAFYYFILPSAAIPTTT